MLAQHVIGTKVTSTDPWIHQSYLSRDDPVDASATRPEMRNVYGDMSLCHTLITTCNSFNQFDPRFIKFVFSVHLRSFSDRLLSSMCDSTRDSGRYQK